MTVLLTAFALMAGLFLAAAVFFTGMVAAVLQGFRRKAVSTSLQRNAAPGPPDRPGRTDDIIDVVTTLVPPDRGDGPR